MNTLVDSPWWNMTRGLAGNRRSRELVLLPHVVSGRQSRLWALPVVLHLLPVHYRAALTAHSILLSDTQSTLRNNNTNSSGIFTRGLGANWAVATIKANRWSWDESPWLNCPTYSSETWKSAAIICAYSLQNHCATGHRLRFGIPPPPLPPPKQALNHR